MLIVAKIRLVLCPAFDFGAVPRTLFSYLYSNYPVSLSACRARVTPGLLPHVFFVYVSLQEEEAAIFKSNVHLYAQGGPGSTFIPNRSYNYPTISGACNIQRERPGSCLVRSIRWCDRSWLLIECSGARIISICFLSAAPTPNPTRTCARLTFPFSPSALVAPSSQPARPTFSTRTAPRRACKTP